MSQWHYVIIVVACFQSKTLKFHAVPTSFCSSFHPHISSCCLEDFEKIFPCFCLSALTTPADSHFSFSLTSSHHPKINYKETGSCTESVFWVFFPFPLPAIRQMKRVTEEQIKKCKKRTTRKKFMKKIMRRKRRKRRKAELLQQKLVDEGRCSLFFKHTNSCVLVFVCFKKPTFFRIFNFPKSLCFTLFTFLLEALICLYEYGILIL